MLWHCRSCPSWTSDERWLLAEQRAGSVRRVDASDLLDELVETDMAVAEGERMLGRQQVVLRLLRARRCDTTRVEKLLENLKRAQALLLNARAKIRTEIEEFRSDPRRLH